jgi:hypothetical protein
MMDLVYVTIAVGFFALCWGLAAFAGRGGSSSERSS